MGKRLSRHERLQEEFCNALYSRDKEEVMRLIKQPNMGNLQFTDLNLSALQMATLWGYQKQVKQILKSGKLDSIAQQNDGLGENLFVTARRSGTPDLELQVRRRYPMMCSKDQTEDEYSHASQWPLPRCVDGELLPAQISSTRKMVQPHMIPILEQPVSNSLFQSRDSRIFLPALDEQEKTSFHKARQDIYRNSGFRSTVGSDCIAYAQERSTIKSTEVMPATRGAKALMNVIQVPNPKKLELQVQKSVEIKMKILDESYELSIPEESIEQI